MIHPESILKRNIILQLLKIILQSAIHNLLLFSLFDLSPHILMEKALPSGSLVTWLLLAQVRPLVPPNQGSNSWPKDHDNTFHVTETPALTTWPSVTTSTKTKL